MALLIKTNGEIKEVKPSNKKDFCLEELQFFVGGYIEQVSIDENNIFICNEEGILHNLSFNELATEKIKKMIGNAPNISVQFFGDVLICNNKEIK